MLIRFFSKKKWSYVTFGKMALHRYSPTKMNLGRVSTGLSR
uniref:Uncharacterized protein n=1 Tax=Arundo donax TaxID=35708 RepID=A0A0A9F2X2_ARUDO